MYWKYQSRDWKRYIIVPEIRLEGKWLKELGFEIGKEIEAEQQKNKLIITLTDKKQEK
ncbi:MAG: type I addiction module toxin, SymE family [Flavobacteriaceae bacterium]|nr:MAG: type I addiction module toxin, SymE family [Flavobacteriaceae bacterium]